jgi:hypothetical protein
VLRCGLTVFIAQLLNIRSTAFEDEYNFKDDFKSGVLSCLLRAKFLTGPAGPSHKGSPNTVTEKLSKSKAISVTGSGSLYGCKILRIPHCLDSRLTDGGKIVSPTHRPLLYSPETLFLCF